ncbi:MAG: GH3 auxin-responsive promoter family protein [Bacteroidetes bacterium]|nr:GH3 auxin-responsive promoter family protein [Bacteroidota bacterium]
MNLLSPAISSLARMRSWRIDAWRDNPLNAQREVLQDLVSSAQYTEFGRRYNFESLFNVHSFKEAVPIHTYEDLKPYIDRIVAGEQNILWNTPINWFAKSSGTTSERSKFIPVSEEALQEGHYKASKDVLTLYYCHRPDSTLLTGKALIIGGSHTLNPLNPEAQVGDLSAVLLQNSPFWGHWFRTPDLQVALMDEWEAKIEKLAEQTVLENVTSISGVPTWTLVLFRKILAITGKSSIAEVWPSLELYLHGGVSFTPYKQQFSAILGKEVTYLNMYNASEGFFAAQDDPAQDGMLLFTDHGIFMEFMPVSEYGSSNPKTIGLKDVEIGQRYALVISTNSGLWRYLVGDTIEFVSLHPFRIHVVGRLKHYINAFGEEVIVDNTDNAIATACAQTGATVVDYTAAPIYFGEHSNGAHEWLIEFEQPPSSLANFASILDQSLQQLNSDYEAKRYRSIALREPVVCQVARGTFAAWLKQKGKLGGQHKVPRLSNDRTVLEQILQLNNPTFVTTN